MLWYYSISHYGIQCLVIIILGQLNGSRQSHKQRLSSSRYKKSYDPYDSHGEDGDECPHCDQHSGAHPSGKHSDCCPRYVDASLVLEGLASDDENVMEMSRNGGPPKRRHIQPLHFPGQISITGDAIGMDQNETGSDEELNLSVDDDGRRFDDSRIAVGGGTTDQKRAPSAGGSYRRPATRSVRSTCMLLY
ncbi:MAG: hypothetical protein H7X94_05555 [Vallitaleaceae bacterium]|nr:hypothetical protein [Vallitaleaceae bacterium]